MVGFRLAGLQGAVVGLALTELVVLALGSRWIRPHLSWPALRLDVRQSLPYIRFGLLFFVGALLHTALGASSEAMVRAITGDYAQVGYFGLAWRVFITMSLAIAQLSSAFIPLLTALHTQGRAEAVQAWVERLLRYMLIGGVLVSFAVFFLAEDVVPVVLGAEFAPATRDLVWLVPTLIPAAIGSAARMVVVTYVRPRMALQAAAIHLIVFWILAVPGIFWLGDVGGSVSMLVAWALYAAVYTWRARELLRYPLRRSGWVVGLAVLLLPLSLLRSSWWVNVGLFGISVVGYVSVLLVTRAVTTEEVAQLWQTITNRPKAHLPEAP
jgi:O-antigen/teichoic acid export membrane protein